VQDACAGRVVSKCIEAAMMHGQSQITRAGGSLSGSEDFYFAAK
jgi:hypothetical protein